MDRKYQLLFLLLLLYYIIIYTIIIILITIAVNSTVNGSVPPSVHFSALCITVPYISYPTIKTAYHHRIKEVFYQ